MNDAAVGTNGAGNPGELGRVLPVVAVVAAGALQLVVGWLTSTSGLMAPLWAIVVLGLVWLAAVALLVRVARRRPLLAPLVPVANGLLWWVAMSAGEMWLGWSA